MKKLTFMRDQNFVLQCISVEILAFGVYNNPLLLREAHTIDRTMLITFLDRRIVKTAERADKSVFQ